MRILGRLNLTMIAAILLLIGSCIPLLAQQPLTLDVSAFANPWFNDGGGVNPPFVSFPASAGKAVRFLGVTGLWSCAFFVSSTGPDTGGCLGPVDIAGVNGVSGFSDPIGRPLIGMFLEDQDPPLSNAAAGIGQIFKVGNGQDALGKPLTVAVPPSATRLMLAYPDDCQDGLPGCYFDNAGSVTATFTIGCHADVTVSIGAGGTAMEAAFTPTNGVSLNDAAHSCGFVGFNWQQTLTVLPSPSPFFAKTAPSVRLTAPPPFNDGPPGGYTYQSPAEPPFEGSFPFYYNTSDVPTACAVQDRNGVCIRHITEGNTLNFFDLPQNTCLPGGPGNGEPICAFSAAPPNSFMGFTTALVGVVPGNAVGDTLKEWSWKSTFNGESGGIATTQNNRLTLPKNGTGGITITSIDRVPQSPPQIDCQTVPNILWPPDGRNVPVIVSGHITNGTLAVNPATVKYAVLDEYGEIQLRGTISLGAGGSYSFEVPLKAERRGNYRDGRVYTITVSAQDSMGSVGFCSTVARVPHDQESERRGHDDGR
jgi:hypothetical protein